MPHMKPNTTAKWPKRHLFSSWTWNKAVVGKACSGAYSGPPSRSLSRCFPALRGSDGSYEEEWTRGRGLGSRIPPFMNRGMRRKFYHWNLNQKFSPKLQMFVWLSVLLTGHFHLLIILQRSSTVWRKKLFVIFILVADTWKVDNLSS